MRITDLDPLVHGLLFERFLNPERISMPDFDIDFDERRRGEVIRYVTDKYGDDRVAMIVTYGTIKAKQAIKDSSRILGYPFAMGDRITKAMPAAVMGKDVPLKEIFDPAHRRYGEGGEFRSLYESDPDVKRVVDTAIGIEGLKRQWGVHAAGVIMSSEPLADVIPLLRRPADGAIITQFDYPTCEALGLIKMDFLGLRNLTVLDDCINNIVANRGETVVLEELELDDPATYQLLQRGDTLGVFQLDGGPMRALLRSMRPDCFADISAVGALYRPGPMGWTPTTTTPAARPAASPSSRSTPSWPSRWPRSSTRPTACSSTRSRSGHRAEARRLLPGPGRPAAQGDGQEEEGDPRRRVRRLLRGHEGQRLLRRRDQGAVGHPAAVLRLRLQQGPLGGLRPGVLLDRLPQGQLPGRVHGRAADVGQGRQGQVGDLPQRVPPDEDPGPAARRQRVARPTSPRSAPTSASGSPRSATSGTTSSTASSTAREEKGRYADFNDFMDKVPALVCNKRVIESLVKAGAFDAMKHRRRALVAIHEGAVDQYVDLKRNEAIGQDSLFGGLDDGLAAALRHLGDGPRHRRVGQDDAARPRAGDARPLRLRPPAARPRARAVQRHRRHDRPAAARRGTARQQLGHHQWPGHLGAAQDHQEGRLLGDRHGRGPRRRAST